MSDVTVKHLEEMERNGGFLFAGKTLGVSAWGMNVVKMPPNYQDYPDHNHAKDGQEEVYVVLEGSAVLKAGEDDWELKPGMFARVGPEQKRKLVPGAEGATILALGGTPGKAYQLPDWIKG
ncbi:MAG: cupin domain-containing protein [Acidobacteriota bacterium]|jgi:mannose-6-phosphate isomerase-like protein (cupin superfamily)